MHSHQSDAQAALIDRVREVLARSDGFDFDSLEPHDYQIQAAALLTELPAPVDRAAVLREEAALIRAHCPDHLDDNSNEGSWMNCHCDIADDMERRATAEATPQPSGLSDGARIGVTSPPKETIHEPS